MYMGGICSWMHCRHIPSDQPYNQKMYFIKRCDLLKKTYGEQTHAKELLMLQVMKSFDNDDDDDDDIISPLEEKLVYILDNDS